MARVTPYVTITNPDRPAQKVTCMLGQDPPRHKDMDAGWTNKARPMRTSLIEYAGRDQDQLILPVVIDGYHKDLSVEAEINMLIDLSRVGRNQFEPPTVRLSGPVPQRQATTIDWKIATLEWGDYIRSPKHFAIVRQAVVVTLIQAEFGIATVRTNTTSSTKKYRTVTVTASLNTLQKIASHELGDWRRYKELMTLNSIRDPESLKIGKKIKVPA